MVEAAWGGARDADIVVLVVDAVRGLDEEVEGILAKLQDVKLPRLAVLNKVDKLTDKAKLLELATDLQQRLPFEGVFMISATNGDGVEDLKHALAARVPPGPWHYPADDLTDAPLRLLAAEITREKIFHRLHDEVPYASTVETTQWTERKDGSVRIEQTIFVARDGQKAIMLGKGGQTIKQVSMDSRRELTAILERPVHLFLFVKVRQNWQDDPERYREMGLEPPKK
jgi:GTP-binding protein Era